MGFEIDGTLLNRLWTFDQEITNEINEFVEKWAKNNYVIGLQSGSRDSFYLYETKDVMKFINCALNIGLGLIKGVMIYPKSFLHERPCDTRGL